MSNTIKDIEETINWLEDRKWTLVEQDMERAKQEQIEKESREMYAFSVIPEARGGSVRGYGSIRINTETGEISGLDETEENASPEASETTRITENFDQDAFIPLSELNRMDIKHKEPLIDGFLYEGLYLFAGPPKVGKSFFSAGAAFHVSTGESMWGFNVKKAGVVYLALEDTYERIKSRYNRMFGNELPGNLFIRNHIENIDNGLLEILREFIEKHPDIKLIIIDTLQKIKGAKSGYEKDYEIMGTLKEFADKYGLCMLLIHHLRKQGSDDIFNRVTGSTGLTGAVDGTYVMVKTDREAQKAQIYMTGRDIEDKSFRLTRNPDSLEWEFEGEGEAQEENESDLICRRISEIVSQNGGIWSGSATELAMAIGPEAKVSTVTRIVNDMAPKLSLKYGINYDYQKKKYERLLNFSNLEEDILKTENEIELNAM